MLQYHLCVDSEGRVTLDREMHGEAVQTIAVEDPPLEWGWLDAQWVQKPAYYQAYEQARAQVKTGDYEHIPGAGWFKRG
jgi:hypothetical protein